MRCQRCGKTMSENPERVWDQESDMRPGTCRACSALGVKNQVMGGSYNSGGDNFGTIINNHIHHPAPAADDRMVETISTRVPQHIRESLVAMAEDDRVDISTELRRIILTGITYAPHHDALKKYFPQIRELILQLEGSDDSGTNGKREG